MVPAMQEDPFNLHRFVEAQDHVFDRALEELRSGRKQSHWMWFVFPQISGLGHSRMAQFYGIGSAAEGRAYLAHPVLGKRLAASTWAVLEHKGKSAREIMGSPDDLKFRSSMTLFANLAAEGPFREALNAFFEGHPDDRTLSILKKMQ